MMWINGNFEDGWWRKTHTGQEYGEIFVPLGWVAFWDEAQGRPEMHAIPDDVPYLDPPRTYTGQQAVQWFTFFRRHAAGIYQRVTGLIPGALYRFSVFVHAWYSQYDDPYKSEWDDNGVRREIHDGDPGMAFYLGVDLTGAEEPDGETVNWTVPHNLYNEYGLAGMNFLADSEAATLFIKSVTDCPFKHCDAYVDAATLAEIEDHEPECYGLPREDYPRVYNVLPQNATLGRFLEVATLAYPQRQTVGFSHDDACIGDLTDKTVKTWDIAPAEQAVFVDWYAEHYPGTKVEFHGQSPPPPPPVIPPVIPPPGWTPTNYVKKGTKFSFHCVGCYPADRTNTLAMAGVTLSSIKLVQAIGDFPVTREPFKIGRMIDYNGQKLEGFDYTLGRGTPEQQADLRMSKLIPIFAPYKQYGLHLEIINEQDPQSPADHILLARFFMQAMTIAEENGYKLALFSHSLGTPEPGEWDAIANTGIFEQAAAGGHAISLHEYSDASGGPNFIICRYRYLYDHIILPRGLDIPLFITEYNVPLEMLGGDIFGQWITYDNLVRQDPYVAGVHIYTLGIGEYNGYKQAVVDRLAAFVNYAIAEKDKING